MILFQEIKKFKNDNLLFNLLNALIIDKGNKVDNKKGKMTKNIFFYSLLIFEKYFLINKYFNILKNKLF